MNDSERRTVILNPVSGNAQHVEQVQRRATVEGYEVKETQGAGDAIRFATEAAEGGASLIGAAGGDGTLNEVVQGVDRAESFEDVTIGVIPVGTGNNFAQNIDIATIDEGFDVMEHGERRQIDLGRANGRVFVNSCIAGLTADASGATSAELKNRLGVLAYVITTLRSMTTFEGYTLSITIDDGETNATAWEGDVLCVLVGNGRRFTSQGGSQANMEDGLFDVTIIEDVPGIELMGEAVVERLLGKKATHLTRLRASTLDITALDSGPMNYSLDGEMIQARTLSLDTQPEALRIAVGDGYEPDPGDA